ncbi:protein phosphatase 2C domain-containing protein [Catellatospora citrea]|uniref:protein phosphatase 2C domain-containing protein n=1 Tax=Catellatospora citrea TaxID=53366 RepID=UPI00340554A9
MSQVAAEHGPACDLNHPLTPAATVAIVRLVGDQVEWLVLGDATVAWTLADGSTDAATDDRADHLPNAPVIVADVRRYDPDFVAKVRNQPGGFWVAAADATAAYQSLTGAISRPAVQRVGLMSDGVSRLVERYNWRWSDVFDHVDQHGARSLIAAVREAEATDPDPSRWRGKPHDDATAIVARIAT